MSIIYEEKLEILEDMTAQISEVITNSRYLRFYYLVDDVVRNKGCITLLRPEYCNSFAALLKLILKRVNKRWGKNKEIIEMKMNLLSEECVFIK